MTQDVARFQAMEEAVREAGAFVVAGAAAIRVVEGTLPGDDNPHTDLDRRTDALLHRLLLACFPPAGAPAWLTEERADDPARLGAAQVLIVDPIDGTRNLLERHPEATISVALWRRGALAWACVHNPFRAWTVTAVAGRGTRVDGRPAAVSPCDDPAAARLVMSRHEHASGRLAALAGHAAYRPVGSVAYKMACVAAGEADATLTVHPRCEWDLAAGTLLVREAGGRVTDAHGRDLSFNRPTLAFPGVVATNGRLHDWALGLAGVLRGGAVGARSD